MRKTIRFFIWIAALVGVLHVSASNVSAHQPRLVKEGEITQVQDAKISKAYYGVLKGSPAVFEISETEQFFFYINILVPALPDSHVDFSARVERINPNGQNMTIGILDGSKSSWAPFHEEFANDDYLKGPEFKMRVPKGMYRITLSNPSNQGAYALAVGDQESFPLSESIDALKVIPKVKTSIFQKSALSFLNSRIGFFILTLVVILICGSVLLTKLFRKKHLHWTMRQPGWHTWYTSLRKPAWTPSGRIISLIWGVLYPIIALSLVYVIMELSQKTIPFWLASIFIINALANIAFTPIMFHLRNLKLALVDIVIVWITIVAEIYYSWQYSEVLSVAQLPYLIWVSIATYLQFLITRNNKRASK